MCIGGGLGLDLTRGRIEEAGDPFAEPLATYLLCGTDMKALGVRAVALGEVTREPVFRLDAATSISVAELTRAWRGESGESAGIAPIHAPN